MRQLTQAVVGNPKPERSDDWETPKDLFNKLHSEFGFDLDVCASAGNAKCKNYFDKQMDGLKQGWSGRTCWMNPPYSEAAIWIKKAYEESTNGATVVCLVNASTDTAWFHDYVLPFAEIRFIRGRVKFKHPTLDKSSPVKPSIIAIFRPQTNEKLDALINRARFRSND